MRTLVLPLGAMACLGLCAVPARAQDSTSGAEACPAVDSAVKGSIQPHSYVLGWYDGVADSTHLEGGGTEPRIHVDLRLAYPGASSALPAVGIIDVLLGDPYVEPARISPDTTHLVLLLDDSLRARTIVTGRRYRRMDPYPITIQGALSPKGFTTLLNASRALLVYGNDTIPARAEVIEGLHRLGTALRCAPVGIPKSP